MSFEKHIIKKRPWAKIIYGLLCLLLGGIAGTVCSLYTANPSSNVSGSPAYAPHFSPKGGCTEAIVKEINAAKKTIYMQAYSFCSKPIGDALCAAEKRGIKLCILVDRGRYESGKASQIDRLNGDNTLRYISQGSAYAHIKTLVVDDKSFPVGSFNMDKNAEEVNRENILYVHGDSEACKRVIQNCIRNCQKAIPYEEYKEAEANTSPKKKKRKKTSPKRPKQKAQK